MDTGTPGGFGEMQPRSWLDRHAWLATVIGCTAVAALLWPLHGRLALANIAMVLLLVVALVAYRFGRGPAVLASGFNVAVFDLGFVPPRGSFTVDDAEYLIVFAVMLAVALIISQISGDLRARRQTALAGEARQRALYELAAALSKTLKREQVIDVVGAFLRGEVDADMRFHGTRVFEAGEAAPDAAVRAVYASGLATRLQDGESPRPLRQLLPLRGATRLRGVLDLRLPGLSRMGEERPHEMRTHGASGGRDALLETVADLMAAALERLHYLDVAARTQAEIDAERLRNSLLATLSHDLRTPLTVLYGRADALRDTVDDPVRLREQAAAVCDEALRANRLCESLLDLAQVRSAAALLRRDWMSIDEIVGAALASLAGVPGIERVAVDLPADLPWLRLDPTMCERVIANLVDNALKQGGLQQDVRIVADHDATQLRLCVRNSGSRFPDDAQSLLQAFTRGQRSDRTAGFGIGLATTQAVIAAHGGEVTLRNRDGFAEVELRLPLPTEPAPTLPDGGRP